MKGRIIFVQPTIPKYREAFFNLLCETLGSRLVVCASDMDIGAISDKTSKAKWRNQLGQYRQIMPGLFWQEGALNIEIAQGDLVVVSGAPRCITNIGVLVKARRAGARVMWWGHYMSASSKPIRAAMRFKLLRLADSALFYTDAEAKKFRQRFSDLNNFPVFALNNGIDNREIRLLRGAYVAGDIGKRILFIGRLTEKSKLAVLLAALSYEKCRDIHLDIIGDGSGLPDLQSYSREIGIENRVVWHGGIVDEIKIAGVANRCKLFVYPGSVGLSLIHALAYGLPVIVHDNRATHMPEIEAFRHGVTGISFTEGSSSSLAKAISTLIDDQQRLDVMSENALALTDSTFNAEDMVQRFIRALEVLDCY